MGKNRNLQQQQQQADDGDGDGDGPRGTGDGASESGMFCDRCSVRLRRLFCDRLTARCVVVLVLGLAALVSWIFWILPSSHALDVGYDAAYSVKRGAVIQASFKLRKPVPELIRLIRRLEYDIYGEISVPDTKVVLLSMHRSDSSDDTNIVFGVLSNPSTTAINQVDLSLLRSLFIELFLRQSNLTLTKALFGQTSDFEILKFPGGLTVIPANSASIWQIPQILFNFVLGNSITEIQQNSFEFREQLKRGLLLGSHENIYVQVTNKEGSTVDPQVTVQASVMSDFGSLVPERLKQLAEIITGSRSKNLGLDYSVFGNVKSVSLSSYMRESIEATSPTPSPAPSPDPSYFGEPPSPSPAPSASYPYLPCPERHHSRSPPLSSSVALSAPSPSPKYPFSDRGFRRAANRSPTWDKGYSSPTLAPLLPPKDSISQLSPAFPPVPGVSSSLEGGNEASSKSSMVEPSSSSLASQHLCRRIFLWGALAVTIQFLLPILTQ